MSEDNILSSKIVVTGGNGFLGTSVVEALKAHGATQILAPRKIQYDLTEPTDVKRLYQDLKPEVVVHLAAVVGGIGANRENPGRFFYENAVMGIHLIEEARNYGVKKIVVAGTVCAYPKFCPVPFSEENLWEGYPEETNAPYGLAKKMLLVQLQAYRQQYGLNGVYLLPVNLYGPRDNFDLQSSHVIPALIRKCVEAKENGDKDLVVWGTGSASREFLYVDDAAEGIALATKLYNGSDPVNLGASREIKIKELVETIAKLVGFSGNITWDASKPDGQPRRCIDTTRAKERFGFIAKTSFEDGLKKTIEWYLKNRK